MRALFSERARIFGASYYIMKTVKDLTAEQKLRLICGRDCWTTVSFDGVPSFVMSDGPVGLRTDRGEGALPAVAYPAAQVLANSWNAELAYEVGEALADDCIERDVDILLGPGVNIKRSPLCGRNFEYFSEDPYLAGVLAREYVRGVQSNGVGVCVKHYYANNLEYDRFHQSSDVDERTLREVYLKPFEMACEAKPVSVMCSYNRINGVYAAENKKGFDILRDEFGFDGAVISDWGAVRDRAASAKAGLDLEMPFNQDNYDRLVADYKSGKLSDAELDACAERVLKVAYEFAEKRATRKVKRTTAERMDVSANILAEGVVLLKNDGILPLDKKSSVSVCGCFAKPCSVQMYRGGGSSEVTRYALDADLPARLAERVEGKVRYEEAFRFDGVDGDNTSRIAISNAARSDVNIVCVGTGAYIEHEGGDRSIAAMRLPGAQERAILEMARQNANTVVLIFAGSAIDVSSWRDAVAAIMYVGFPGERADAVLADILTGAINPSGKLSETFALDYWDYRSSLSPRADGVTRYQEGLDVGYRYFDTYNEPVAYPFGHGLSYSEFAYKELKLKAQGDKLDVKFKIKNASERDGKEVAQVYVRPIAPLVYRPNKELKAFCKTEIKAGEREEIKITLDKKAFAYWSTAIDGRKTDDGLYEILVGASSADIRLAAKVDITDGEIKVL